MLLIFISCWYLEASVEPESYCDKLHSLVVHDSSCPNDCIMRDAGILERDNSYCKFTCLKQTHHLLTSQQMQPALGESVCVFDNKSIFISSSTRGDGPCCQRYLWSICHKATNKPLTASARGQKLGYHIPENSTAGSREGQKNSMLLGAACLLSHHGKDKHRPHITCSHHSKAWSISLTKITPT